MTSGTHVSLNASHMTDVALDAEVKTLRTRSGHPVEKALRGRVGDWLCPLLVWMMCIGMLLALLSALVGRAE